MRENKFPPLGKERTAGNAVKMLQEKNEKHTKCFVPRTPTRTSLLALLPLQNTEVLCGLADIRQWCSSPQNGQNVSVVIIYHGSTKPCFVLCSVTMFPHALPPGYFVKIVIYSFLFSMLRIEP